MHITKEIRMLGRARALAGPPVPPPLLGGASNLALVRLCVLPSPVKVPPPVKVARPVIAPGSFIGTGIVPHPFLMIFRIIRNSFPTYKRFP